MNSVSIILPTLNESKNIILLIEEIKKNISKEWDFEIIVVDDDSLDGTIKIVQKKYSAEKNIICIERKENHGLAASIYDGILNSKGNKTLVMDTDFTHDPKEIPNLLHICQFYDIVSGSRFAPGGNMSSKRHYFASWIYNIFLRLAIRTQVQDNLGGYFVADRKKLMGLPHQKIFFGYGDYYFRLLHFAQINSMSIVEIPAFYSARVEGESKSSFFRMLFSYTKAILKFKSELSKINK